MSKFRVEDLHWFFPTPNSEGRARPHRHLRELYVCDLIIKQQRREFVDIFNPTVAGQISPILLACHKGWPITSLTSVPLSLCPYNV